MEMLNIKNLNFTYPAQSEKTLKDINFNVNQSEFVVVFGKSGSGKSTLLKMIKSELRPYGEISGTIKYFDKDVLSSKTKISAKEIGFLLQNPKTQIVTDKVCHELYFGCENLNMPTNTIKRLSAETSDFFNITHLYNKNTHELSGGQTQLLNLASVLVTKPKLLILDEPLSQLDPISLKELITILKRLNEEFSITIIIAEHRLEELLPLADKAIYIENGNIKYIDTPRNISNKISGEYIKALPVGVSIYQKLGMKDVCPLTIKESRQYILKHLNLSVFNDENADEQSEIKSNYESILNIKNLYFRYKKNENDIINNLSLNINKGEVLSIIGANGSGKTTLLKLICNILKPYSGKIKKNKKDKILILPQSPIDLFIHDTVEKELNYANLDKFKYFEIENFLNLNPLDLSMGEQQKVAIVKLLLQNPNILLLDEPTKGMDIYSKEILCDIIKNLKSHGVTVIIVTHDIEFSATISDRCAFMFRGEIVACDDIFNFLSDNMFYQTVAGKISKNIFKNILSTNALLKECEKRYAHDKK